MQRIRLATIGAAVAVLGIAGVCSAQYASMENTEKEIKVKPLKIGDPARDIDIAHWIKPGELLKDGEFEPITTFNKGEVYVLEFWATWCGPCIAAMPHVSELQEKYKDYDVMFIGVSDEQLPTVVSFLFKEYKRDQKIHNDRIGYTLTTDPDGSVYRDYMKAAGQNGIPTAFIIGKDSKIEWIGHPMTIDKPLEQIVHDNWDRDVYAADMKKQDELQKAMQTGNHKKTLKLIDEMLETDADNNGLLWQKFYILLFQMDQPKEAYAIAQSMVKTNWDDTAFLNQLAWVIADSPEIKVRDLDLAMKAATRANDLTDSKDPAILDTLARVYFEKGDVESAIKWQQKAVENSKDDGMGEDIRSTLEKYESKK